MRHQLRRSVEQRPKLRRVRDSVHGWKDLQRRLLRLYFGSEGVQRDVYGGRDRPAELRRLRNGVPVRPDLRGRRVSVRARIRTVLRILHRYLERPQQLWQL